MRKKKVLVLGADGMLGHELVNRLQKKYSLYGTVRSNEIDQFLQKVKIKIYNNLSCENFSSFKNLINKIKPSYVINCIGVIKQRSNTNDVINSLLINSLFPHQLSKFCEPADSKLIHFSTDCVFSGAKGDYSEEDYCDPLDIYGRTKHLGEVSAENTITLRTSIIGPELKYKKSLYEWFIAQENDVFGYSNAIYTGFTTLEMSNIVDMIMSTNFKPGLFNVSSNKISKYDLLQLFKKHSKKTLQIHKDDKVICDRSLNSTKFRNTFNFHPKSWNTMISEMMK